MQLEEKETKENLCIKNAVEFGKFSFELEEKREQSILTQSSQMLTAFSLFSAAVLMSFPLVADYTGVPDIYAFYLSAVALFPLIISLVLAIVAQWRFKYETLKSTKDFADELQKNHKDYQSQSDYDWQWIYQLDAVQVSKKKNNNRRVIFVRISMILFLVSVGILVIGNIGFFLIYK